MGKSKWKSKAHGGRWAIFEKGLEEYRREMLALEWWNKIKPESQPGNVVTRKQKRRAEINECIKNLEILGKQKMAEKKEKAKKVGEKVTAVLKKPLAELDKSSKSANSVKNVAKTTQPIEKLTPEPISTAAKHSLVKDKLNGTVPRTLIEHSSKVEKETVKQEQKCEIKKSEKEITSTSAVESIKVGKEDKKKASKEKMDKPEKDPEKSNVGDNKKLQEESILKLKIDDTTIDNKCGKRPETEQKKEISKSKDKNLQGTNKKRVLQRDNKVETQENKIHIGPSKQDQPSEKLQDSSEIVKDQPSGKIQDSSGIMKNQPSGKIHQPSGKIQAFTSERVPCAPGNRVPDQLMETAASPGTPKDTVKLKDLDKGNKLSIVHPTESTATSVSIMDTNIKPDPQETKDKKTELITTESKTEPEEQTKLVQKLTEEIKNKPREVPPKLDIEERKDVGEAAIVISNVEPTNKEDVKNKEKTGGLKKEPITILATSPSQSEGIKKVLNSGLKQENVSKEKMSSNNKVPQNYKTDSKVKKTIPAKKKENKTIGDPLPQISLQHEKLTTGESKDKLPQIQQEHPDKHENKKEQSTKLTESRIPATPITPTSHSKAMSQTSQKGAPSPIVTTPQMEGQKFSQNVLDDAKQDRQNITGSKIQTLITDDKKSSPVVTSIKNADQTTCTKTQTLPSNIGQPHISGATGDNITPVDVIIKDDMSKIKSEKSLFEKTSILQKEVKNIPDNSQLYAEKKDFKMPAIPIDDSVGRDTLPLTKQEKQQEEAAVPLITEIKEDAGNSTLPKPSQTMTATLQDKAEPPQVQVIMDEKQAAPKSPKEQQKITASEKRHRRKTKSGDKEAQMQGKDAQKSPTQGSIIPKLSTKPPPHDKDVSKVSTDITKQDNEMTMSPENIQSKEILKIAGKTPQESNVMPNVLARSELQDRETAKPPAKISPKDEEKSNVSQKPIQQDKEIFKPTTDILEDAREASKILTHITFQEKQVLEHLPNTSIKDMSMAGSNMHLQEKTVIKPPVDMPCSEKVPKLETKSFPEGKGMPRPSEEVCSHGKLVTKFDAQSAEKEERKLSTKTHHQDQKMSKLAMPPQDKQMPKISPKTSQKDHEIVKLLVETTVHGKAVPKLSGIAALDENKEVLNVQTTDPSQCQEVPKLPAETVPCKELPRTPSKNIQQSKKTPKAAKETAQSKGVLKQPQKEQIQRTDKPISEDKASPELSSNLHLPAKCVPQLLEQNPKCSAEIPPPTLAVAPKILEKASSHEKIAQKHLVEISKQEKRCPQIVPKSVWKDQKLPLIPSETLAQEKEEPKLTSDSVAKDTSLPPKSLKSTGPLPKLPSNQTNITVADFPKPEQYREIQNVEEKTNIQSKINQKGESKTKIPKQHKGPIKQGDKNKKDIPSHEQKGPAISKPTISAEIQVNVPLTHLADAIVKDELKHESPKISSVGTKPAERDTASDKASVTKSPPKGKRTRQRSKRDSESEKELQSKEKCTNIQAPKQVAKSQKPPLSQTDGKLQKQDKVNTMKLSQTSELEKDKVTETVKEQTSNLSPDQQTTTLPLKQKIEEPDKRGEFEHEKVYEQQIQDTQPIIDNQAPKNIQVSSILSGCEFSTDVLAQHPPNLSTEPPKVPDRQGSSAITPPRFKSPTQGIMASSPPSQLPFGIPMNQSAAVQALPPQYQQGANITKYQQSPNTTQFQQGMNRPQFQQGQNSPQFQHGQNTMPMSFARGISPSTQFSPGQGLPPYFQPGQSDQRPFISPMFGHRPPMGRSQQLPRSPGTPSNTPQQTTFLTQGENDEDIQVPSLFDNFM